MVRDTKAKKHLIKIYKRKIPNTQLSKKEQKSIIQYYRDIIEQILLENSFLERRIQIAETKLKILNESDTKFHNHHNFKNLKVGTIYKSRFNKIKT